MYPIKILATVIVAALMLLAGGCSKAESSMDAAASSLVVHKTPTCGCCGEWVKHMEAAGFETTVHVDNDLAPIKESVGLPYGLGSCHTAKIQGYFIEGHVPAADVKRLLAERPDARGLTVPGMPLGSPGMEVPSGRQDAYEVLLVLPDGSTEVFARHGSP